MMNDEQKKLSVVGFQFSILRRKTTDPDLASVHHSSFRVHRSKR